MFAVLLYYCRQCRTVIDFFFFQAEDGIRDYKVTGVQTCALPISFAAGPVGTAGFGAAGVTPAGVEAVAAGAGAFVAAGGCAGVAGAAGLRRAALRSEERRVGEEGRSRWAPDH